MDKAEEFILEHVYDPRKRREYYLRTRELKGRRNGAVDETSNRQSGVLDRVSDPRDRGTRGPDTNAERKTPETTRAEVKARVDQLKNRLDKLKDVLDELVEQAKLRSGVKPEEDKDKKDTSSDKDRDRKPSTAKERREARERYEKDKEKNPSLRKEEAQLQEQIADVRAKIEDAREDLKVAIARARQRAARKEKATESSRPLERKRQNGS